MIKDQKLCRANDSFLLLILLFFFYDNLKLMFVLLCCKQIVVTTLLHPIYGKMLLCVGLLYCPLQGIEILLHAITKHRMYTAGLNKIQLPKAIHQILSIDSNRKFLQHNLI
jgi:hypothetical protein